MTLNAIVMLSALLGALGFFSYSVRQRVLVMKKAKPDHTRTDQIGRRLMHTLSVAVGQQKMFKEPAAGIMHALIFWGFLVLLFRSITLIGQAFAPEWTILWFSVPLENIYTLTKDLTELIVLLMVAVALFRRFVVKPWRISLSWDANLVLGLIGFLMLSDFLMDGARFVLHPGSVEELWAPVGASVAEFYLAKGMSVGTAAWVAGAFYWLHIAALFFFLNYLPYSKHMHVLTVVQNVFLANLQPGHPLQPIKDIEEQETFGAQKIEEFTWKDILDIYTCTECGRCMTNCPTTLTDKALRPKELTEAHKHHLEKVAPAILNGEHEREETLIDASKWQAIWDCTTCRACEENCPETIEYVGRIVEMRRYLMLMEANMPEELTATMRGLEAKSNPWGLAPADRGAWAIAAGIPTFAEKPDAEYLFYLGCANSYDDRSTRIARAFAMLLDKAGISYAILGEMEGCCGDQARRLGNEYLFQIQAQTNIEVFNELGIKKILTTCPHGYQVLKNEYPQFGGSYEVLHHTEFLAQLVAQGRLEPKKNVDAKIAFHDSCYLGRYNNIYDDPREILDRIPGTVRVEAERSREKGFCCGAGGGRVWMEEEGTRINQTRVDQLTQDKPDQLVSACPFCLMMFKDGVADLGMDEQVKVRDLAEVLAESCL